VRLVAAGEVIAAETNPFAVQPEAALQAGAVHTSSRVKIDGGPRSRLFCFAHWEMLSDLV
jgi:hypothetical protein